MLAALVKVIALYQNIVMLSATPRFKQLADCYETLFAQLLCEELVKVLDRLAFMYATLLESNPKRLDVSSDNWQDNSQSTIILILLCEKDL